MAHLIDKDALVAEITKRKKRNVLNEGAFEEDIDILSFINTLEVKEVDLEKEIDKELDRNWYGEYINLDKFRESANHFFELGLKAQKVE